VLRSAVFLFSAVAWAGEPAAHVVWNAAGATVLGAPTADGKWLTCVDPVSRDLAVIETTTGKLRRLTAKGASAANEFAYFSVASRDGQRVAYAWFNDAGFYDLRVTSMAGGAARVLYRNPEAGFVQPTSWTPDDRQILTLFFRADNISQIALVDAESGAVRVLKSLNWVYPKRMEISPDGKWIVYDSFGGDKPGPRDIYLLAIDGSRETKLVEGPGDDLFPAWSPDGKEIVFASDRAGTMDVWAVRIGDGRALVPPRLVKRDLKQFLPMGVTAAGDLYYGLRVGTTDVAVIKGDGSSVLATRTPGRNFAPAWSRDGKRLAYLSRRGAENFGVEARVIVVHDMESATERDLDAKLAHVESLRWSPDGEWLLAAGSDGKGRSGLFRVRVKDGLVRPEVVEERADYRGVPGDWLPDGTVAAGTGARAVAVSASGRVARAYDDRVVMDDSNWTIRGVTWLAWAGERLLGAQGVRAIEFGSGVPRELSWKDYSGGPFSIRADGAVVMGIGGTRHEVWVMEHVFAPLDNKR
jgi:Tol biopolymer transport system component